MSVRCPYNISNIGFVTEGLGILLYNAQTIEQIGLFDFIPGNENQPMITQAVLFVVARLFSYVTHNCH